MSTELFHVIDENVFIESFMSLTLDNLRHWYDILKSDEYQCYYFFHYVMISEGQTEETKNSEDTSTTRTNFSNYFRFSQAAFEFNAAWEKLTQMLPPNVHTVRRVVDAILFLPKTFTIEPIVVKLATGANIIPTDVINYDSWLLYAASLGYGPIIDEFDRNDAILP